MSSGLSLASFSAPAIARAAPFLDGMTMSVASDDIAKPATSHKMSAPRARACSYSSNTKMPAPSPCTIPFRLAENGRQASLDMTRKPSHAFTPPKHNMDSDPPVTIAGAIPVRTI